MAWFKHLSTRVLVGIGIGILLGAWVPEWGPHYKLIGELFIQLVKMIIPPIVFCTIVAGVGHMSDTKQLGRIGGKALLYFEVISTVALVIGLGVAILIQPGIGLQGQTAGLVAPDGMGPVAHQGFGGFLKSMIPTSALGALTGSDMLPILVLAILIGISLAKMGESGRPLVKGIERVSSLLFTAIGFIMSLSPIGVMGAIAYTVSKFGLSCLGSLGKMMACSYATMLIFVLLILGLITRIAGIRIVALIKALKSELLLVLGTSSSESALPSLMEKMERLGCSKAVVGLVVPTGYSFNLDGTSIYLSIAVMFIAQAYGIHLGWEQIVMIMGIMMLTSKGAAGITGSGFVTLAATLYALPGHPLPVEGLALLLGVDRFLSEARSITNFLGNAVATVIIAKWENAYTPTGLIDV